VSHPSEKSKNDHEILDLLNDFVDFIELDSTPENSSEEKLTIFLDRLTIAYHNSEFDFDGKEYPDPPAKNYRLLREKVELRFPDLGFYNVAADIISELPKSETTLCDAIDDIVDIGLDMKEIIWRWSNTSKLDALWHFRFGYPAHWGHHLRSIQLYLFSRIAG
jgi:hypothetical protein